MFLAGTLAGALALGTLLAWCERDRGRGGYLDHTPAGLTELTGRTRKPRPGGR